MNLQKTIKETIELEGVGLHNGIKVNLVVKPAEVNSGIKFKRTDVDYDKSIIEASYKNVSSSILCTKIKNSHGVSVSTVEHLMAVFYRTRRKEFKLSKGDLTSIYNSKTFCLYEDIDQIKSQGLAKGGSLENAIVVKENKILNEDGLRYRDEFVNHKILDCLGDLMLTGHRIFGHIKTSQGGHQLTNVLLKKFFSNKSNWEFESFEGKQKDHKNSTYVSSIAVNA